VAAADTIAQNSDTLANASAGLSSAAGDLKGAASELDSSIPSDAFGKALPALAAAGNQVAAAIGKSLKSLAEFAQASAEATKATQAEFERIEEDATAAFHSSGDGK